MEVSITRVSSSELPDRKISLKVKGTAPPNNRVEVSYNEQSETKKVVTADGSGNFDSELTIPSLSGNDPKVFAKLIDRADLKADSMAVPSPHDRLGGPRQDNG